jgi:hypothetical protein
LPKRKKASKKCKEKNGDRGNNDPPSKPGNNNNNNHNQQPSKTANNQPAKTDKPDCDAIGRDDLKALASEIQSDNAIQKRATRTSLQTRRLKLQTRGYGTKKGEVCKKKGKGVSVDSKKYPSAGEKFMVRQMLTAWDDP